MTVYRCNTKRSSMIFYYVPALAWCPQQMETGFELSFRGLHSDHAHPSNYWQLAAKDLHSGKSKYSYSISES